MARPFTSFAPDPERHQRYNAFYQFYTETYPQLRSLMQRMSSVVASQDQAAHH
jgi:sugar (pentulose or hexulose) kinase